MSENRKDEELIRETNPHKKNSYTYGDYLNWSDEQRYELINGEVYIMTPAPYRKHQQVLGALHNQFFNYLANKKCEVYLAPFDLRLPLGNEIDSDINTVVQPDLLVICDQNKLDERGCKGAPDLLIEILSPSSIVRDKQIKRDLYERHGIEEYWIVDYLEKVVEVYILNKEKKYIKPDIYSEKDSLPVKIFQGDLKIELEIVFKDI